MSDRFVVGDTVTLTNTFAVSGVATDPTTVSLVVTDPTGTATSYTYAGGTITKSSTGLYTKNITASTVGLWSYTWTGTGTAADVENGSFTVEATAPITPTPSTSSPSSKPRVPSGSPAATRPETRSCSRRSPPCRAASTACGPIVQRTITDEVHPGGCPSIRVRHWPVASFTTVTEYDATTPTVLTRGTSTPNPPTATCPSGGNPPPRQCSTG